MKLLLTSIVFLVASNVFYGQKYNDQIEQRIKQVENNLASEVQIKGQANFNLQERMAFYNVKGLSMAVIKDYKVEWARGYGWADEEQKRPVTTETLFEPGSISKSLNALAILKLVQEGKLDLSADINTYLKSWKFPYDELTGDRKITLADLLSHTAGLSVHGFAGYNRFGKIPSLPEILDGKMPANSPPVRSEFAPGLKYQYSGGGTTISQLILMDQTKIPYDQFVKKNVFDPLGMSNTFFTQPPSEDKLQLLATGYRSNGSEVDGKFHVYPEQGAAGLWTTPSDLCKYIIESQLAMEGKSSKVLNQEMTKLRMTPYHDSNAALGVFIEDRNGTKYFQHGAGNEGFRGFYYGSMEGGTGVVVFVNSDNGNILFEVMNSVATVYDWQGFYQPVIKQEVKINQKICDEYIGIYSNESRFAHVSKREDGYYLYTNGEAYKIHFSNETDFFNTEFIADRRFVRNELNEVIRLEWAAGNSEAPSANKVVYPEKMLGDEELFNSIGWHLLETKEYELAGQYLKRGLELHPQSLLIAGNLAHAYLFDNRYDEALSIYRSHLNEVVNEDFSWEEMITNDFVFFNNLNYEETGMIKVLNDLKLEVPQEFLKK